MTTGHPLLDAALKSLLAPISVIALTVLLFAGPVFVIGFIANRRKVRYKAEAEEPFTDQPLRPAGESLRLKIEELSDKFDEHLMAIVFTSMSAVLLVLLSPAPQRLWIGIGAAIMASILYVRTGRQLFSLQRNLWNHRLGFAGERVVGEALNQLLVDRFQIFHDVPFDGFNIDHVIVGPAGVFAVETKTRRKRSDMKGPEKARVIFNGESLEYPWGGQETHGLEQAARNAATLSKWLSKATGESTPVKAMLVLPGWFVVCQKAGPVTVLNEKQISYSFPASRCPLADDRIQRIAHQLTERCRIQKPAAA